MFWRPLIRLHVLLAAVAVASCGSEPTSLTLTDFVTGIATDDGAISAQQRRGTAPVANGGPSVTATVAGLPSAQAVSGGSTLVALRAISPFQTVFLSVIDDPLDGYYQLDLPAPTTETTVLVRLAGSIPESTFQTVFSVALGASVGAPSSIANTLAGGRTLSAVAVSGTAPALEGPSQQFTATASFSDGTSQAVTGQATWQSSNAAVVTVNGAGVVSAVGAGEADIRATFQGVTGQLHVAVAAVSVAAGTFTVRGTVTDATSGGVLPGVTVALGNGSTTTDAGGRFTLGGIGAGTVTVTASATGYVTAQRIVSIAGDTQVDFVLARSTAAVSGTVTDASTGGALSGATITTAGKSTTTDAAGKYSLSDISPGSVTLTASLSGYVTSQKTVTIAGNTQVDFALSRIVIPPFSASITIQNGSTCVAPPSGPVTCSFIASTSGGQAPFTFAWTFANGAQMVTASGQQVSPTLGCGFAPGVSSFQVNVTLQVSQSGGGAPATTTASLRVARPAGTCGF